MGKIVVLIAVIIEIAFTAYCVYSNSNQKRIRNIIDISTFAIFSISVLLSIIEWSFRWYAFAVLLLVWAMLAALSLIRNKGDRKAYKCRSIIKKRICRVILAFIALMPAFVFPEYKIIDTTGKFEVLTALYTYTDINRTETYTDTRENRKLNVEFWYPKGTYRTYPLVVFSHGGLGIRTSNESLYNELASHGYVVCSIDHTYQCLFTTDTHGNNAMIDWGYMKELTTHNAQSHKQQSYEYFKKWMKIRTGDINFVIDYILVQADNNTGDMVYRLVDKEKIGVMGHSLGGSAALGIGRSRNDVNAVIALESPLICDIEGVEGDSYIFMDEAYPVPVLNVYSDSSLAHLSEWAQYAQNYAMLSDTDEKTFNVYIKGTGHLTLTDLALTSPFITRILNGHKSETDTVYCLKTINKITLEFFDCYLKGYAMENRPLLQL